MRVRWMVVLALGLVGAFSVTPALAQGASRAAMVADIPFDFVVRDATFPSGEYDVHVRILSSAHALVLKGGGESVLALTRPASSAEAENTGEAKLIFNRYGPDRYFLAEVWMPGTAVQKIPKCDTEKHLVTTSWQLQKVTINLRPREIHRGK